MADINENQEETNQGNEEPKDAEQPEGNSEAQTEATAKEGEAAEGQAEAGDAAKAPEGEDAKAEEKHRRAGGWQRKIDRLERERAMLLDQLAAARPAQQPQATQQPQANDPAAEVEAFIARQIEQRLAARAEQERQQRVQAEFQRRTAEVRAANPDFEEVVESVSDVPVSPALQQALLTSEHGPALMYQLAKNPAELARISALPPIDAAREIGRLEAKVSSTAAPKTTTKSAARPPAPPTSAGSSTTSARNLDDLPLSEYKRAYRSGRR